MSDAHSRLRRATPLLLLVLLTSAACQARAPGATPTAKVIGTASSALHAPSSPPPSIPGMDLRGVGIQVWHPWYGAEASLIDSQVAKFNQENDWGITVRTRGHTSYTELYNAVTEALPGNEGPQVAIALPEYALAWDAEGSVVDLTTYVADPTAGLSKDELSDFPKAFRSQDLVEGRRLGMPAQRSAHLLIYNQTWARELGFAKPPTTPQEFREQASAAHAELKRDNDATNDARGGWLVRPDAMTYLSWLSAFGGGVLDGAGYRFLSPRNLEATVFLKQLYEDGCGWIPPTDEAPAADFAARQALFSTAPLGELSELGRAMASAENPDDWTVLGFPGTDQIRMMVYGSSFVILKSTPEEQLASWLFVRWMLDAEQQKEWVEVTGLFPLRTTQQDTLGEYARSHPQWVSAVALIPEGQEHPQLASWRQVRIMIGDGFEAMFRANTPAGRVAEILAIMDSTARDLSP